MSIRNMPEQKFYTPRLAIFGVGMIGGSVALALKRHQRVGHVIGVGRSRANLEKALQLGVIDQIIDAPLPAVEQADVILLATPVNTIAGLFQKILPALDQSKIVTDVGSVKRGICDAAAATLGEQNSRFVPGHPVAGKEHSGVVAASADLFEEQNVVLTPAANTDADALETIRQMWSVIGARVSIMDPQLHDRVLSVTSHLPHVLAYAMVDFFANCEDASHVYDMAAGGFYDFSRTASSDAEMWRDICLMNRAQILQHIDQFKLRLDNISDMLVRTDGAALENLFASAKKSRLRIIEKRAPHP